MITYVNTVMVSNNNATVVNDPATIQKGQFIFFDVDKSTYSISADTLRFKIGMGTGKTAPQINPQTKALSNVPVIKWSNVINADDIKGVVAHQNAGDTPEAVAIDFNGLNESLIHIFAQGGKRIIVRLTFKDLPTRFRKWTESYEYVTKIGELDQNGDLDIAKYKKTLADDIAAMIEKEYKRARVTATSSNNIVTLTAMPYDDDNTVDSLNWANTVRFNANVYFTDPAAEGWESTNKHFPDGVVITKTPGKVDSASAKLVRDREAQAMGYEGILNRGEGTWPVIKPDMNVDLSKTYNSITIEFENMYRTADDLFRKTKQTVEIYVAGTTKAIEDEIAKLF